MDLVKWIFVTWFQWIGFSSLWVGTIAIDRAYMKITLFRFSNPYNKAANGNCCEKPTSLLCQNSCDPQITMLIKRNSRLVKYFPVRTFTNTNSIDFTQLPTTNEFIYTADSWENTSLYNLIIRIDDADVHTSSDNILQISVNIQGNPGVNMNYTKSTPYSATLRYSVATGCLAGWYGPSCTTPCQSSSTSTCNRFTGAKLCNHGYSGDACDVVNRCLIPVRVNCSFHGNCVHPRHPQPRCVCNPGYRGTYCERRDYCVMETCNNRGVCSNTDSSYNCRCNTGYTGRDCEININECLSGPCVHGTCADRTNDYECTCQAGYAGRNCDNNIDECRTNNNVSRCVHGRCVDGVNRFDCECNEGWQGRWCHEPINECLSNPCQNGATCRDLSNDYTCICDTDYTGRRCEVDLNYCRVNPCQHGECVNNQTSYFCRCQHGYRGVHCEERIDFCSTSPCQNLATCTNNLSSNTGFICSCQVGYAGVLCETDIDYCSSSPCSNGMCLDSTSTFICSCNSGYTGITCNININECDSSPCEHDSECIDQVDGFTCVCTAGYTGDSCSQDFNECEQTTLCNNGTCINNDGSYICRCEPGFTGDHCQSTVDNCNGVNCNYGQCIDEHNSYHCECLTGFTGLECNAAVNYCSNNPCVNGNCYSQFNNYTCDCENGYTGRNCNIDIDECQTQFDICNNGTCLNRHGSYTCTCNSGYTGTRCDIEINECSSNPCVYGTCEDKVDGFVCSCSRHYEGVRCNQPTDYCLSSPCKNNQTCLNTPNMPNTHDPLNASGFTCECDAQWTGELCETKFGCDIKKSLGYPICLNGGVCEDIEGFYSCFCPLGFDGTHCELQLNCNHDVLYNLERNIDSIAILALNGSQVSSAYHSYAGSSKPPLTKLSSQFGTADPSPTREMPCDEALFEFCVLNMDCNTTLISLTDKETNSTVLFLCEEGENVKARECSEVAQEGRCENEMRKFCRNLAGVANKNLESKTKLHWLELIKEYWYWLLICAIIIIIIIITVSVRCYTLHKKKSDCQTATLRSQHPPIPPLPTEEHLDHIYEGVHCINPVFSEYQYDLAEPSDIPRGKRPEPPGCSSNNIYDEPQRFDRRPYMLPMDDDSSYTYPTYKTSSSFSGEAAYQYTTPAEHIYSEPIMQPRKDPLHQTDHKSSNVSRKNPLYETNEEDAYQFYEGPDA